MGRLSLETGIIGFLRCKFKMRSNGQKKKNKPFVEISEAQYFTSLCQVIRNKISDVRKLLNSFQNLVNLHAGKVMVLFLIFSQIIIPETIVASLVLILI